MLGAITGDIIGSVYEFKNIKTTNFPLFSEKCFFTDDTVLTVALAEAILTEADYGELMRSYYNRYPDAGYGGRFQQWARGKGQEPYNSFGNGAAMRISPVGWAYSSLEQVLAKAEQFTAITHNHPEGIKGGQATASAVYLARIGAGKDKIRRYITDNFQYNLSRTCDQIRPDYKFDSSCQGSVPQAITAFLESDSFENAIRLAISLGGDSDTLACITGSIAEAFYGGVPDDIATRAITFLDGSLYAVCRRFYSEVIGKAQQATG